MAVGALVVYFVVGAAWSIVKWYFMVKDKKEKYLEFKADFYACRSAANTLAKEAFDALTDEEKKREFLRQLRSYSRRSFVEIPDPAQFKGKITQWIAYWPWSMINAVLFDLLSRIVNSIRLALMNKFREIARSVYKDVEDDFKVDLK